MADTVLKSITLRNWTTVRQTTVEFPERGLVLVRGINAASRGKMASIGAGKTALGEALSRALFGFRGRYTMLGHYSAHGKGNSYVAVECLHKGKPLKVEMGFKCPELSATGEGLRFNYDGADVQRDHILNTRDDLAKIVTVPPDLCAWTVHLDGDVLRFSDLSESKAVNLLMSALLQPRWDFYQKATNDKANELKRQIANDGEGVENAKANVNELETELQTARANLAEAKNVYDEEVRQAKTHQKLIAGRIAEVTARIGQRTARMTEIKKEIDKRVAQNAEKEKALEIKLNEAQEEKDGLNGTWAALRSKEATAKASLD